MSTEEEVQSIEELLKGRTMSVYSLLLTRDKMGVREIQRELGFSSPSLSKHHLTKLEEAGLVTKNAHGEYSVARTVRVGSLTLFVRIGKRFLPRFAFLATLFTGMLIIYLALYCEFPPRGEDIMFIAMGLIAVLMSLYESYRLLMLKPA
ncbi:MAG: winged helix-turn-helix domain-containing protein [Candidatus Thorarchaeota archaeon]